jgi:hypothetical protein
VAKPDHHQAAMTVESTRLQLIRERLENHFYDAPLASERIAVAVVTALKNLDKASLPH